MKATLILLVHLFGFQLAICQWSTDPNVNNPISVQLGNQHMPAGVSDGSGGMIIAWTHGPDFTIYVQRISSGGMVQWTTNGVQVVPPPTYNSNIEPKIVSDGAGGAIIIYQAFTVFTDNDTYILAQHIDANGVPLWTSPGVPVAEIFASTRLEITTDGSGGAIIAWQSSDTWDVIAQRINAAGIVQWSPNGVHVTNDPFSQQTIRLVPDGGGGCVLAWIDYRSGTEAIYAERLNSSGQQQWTINGVAISPTTGLIDFKLIAESGGGIVCWELSQGEVYAQKFNSSGTLQWMSNGIPICTAAFGQFHSQLVSDGLGGAIFTWQDERNSGSQGPTDIYAQRVNSGGSAMWLSNGVPVCLASAYKYDPQLSSDGNNGAVIVWSDSRPGVVPTQYDIYAQRINSTGTAMWSTNGVGVSTAPESQEHPLIINDGNNGTIIVWQDLRTVANSNDIYTQRLRSNGTLGGSSSLPVTLLNFEGFWRAGKIELVWQTASEQNTDYFEIERSVDARQFVPLGRSSAAGSSSTLKEYSFIDRLPLATTNYYRLKQVDADRRFIYSPIVKVSNHNTELLFNIYPNPAKDHLQVSYGGKKEMVVITIYDATGRLVREQKNQLQLPLQINVANLKPGSYCIQLTNGQTTQRGVFVKE